MSRRQKVVRVLEVRLGGDAVDVTHSEVGHAALVQAARAQRLGRPDAAITAALLHDHALSLWCCEVRLDGDTVRLIEADGVR